MTLACSLSRTCVELPLPNKSKSKLQTKTGAAKTKPRKQASSQKQNLSNVTKNPPKSTVSRSATPAEIENAIEELVSNMLHPQRPFRIPRPCGPPVHAFVQQHEIVVTAATAGDPLNGVIKVFQGDFDKHISITVPQATAAVTGVTTTTDVDSTGHDLALFAGKKYTFASSAFNAGNRIESECLDIADDNYEAWNPQTHEFEARKIWVLKMTWTATAHSIVAQFDKGASVNPGTGILRITTVNIAENDASIGPVADVTILAGTTNYTDSNAVSGAGVALVYIPGADTLCDFHSVLVSGIAGNFIALKTTNYPFSVSSEIAAAIKNAEEWSQSGMATLLSFEGGATKAGHMSSAVVNHGKEMPVESAEAIAEIKLLLPKRKYEGAVEVGAHVSWCPNKITDLYLHPWNEKVNSPYIMYSFQMPAANNFQQASLRLYTWTNVELLTSNPLFDVRPGLACPAVTEAVVNVFGHVNPCGENPNHWSKIKKIAKQVSKDPFVREFASLALKGAKVFGPAAVSLLA